MMYMKGRTRNYPVIFEKTTLGNYRIKNMYQNIGQVFLKINLRNYF